MRQTNRIHLTSVCGSAALLAALAVNAASPSQAAAQTRTLTWTEIVEVEVPGALGTLLSVTGVTDPRQSSHSLHLQGSALIQEDDQISSVFDLENGRWLTADHESRTYMTMEFDDLRQLSQEALDGAYASAAAGPDRTAAREELDRALEEAEASIDFRVGAEATGERRAFGAGITAQRHLITAEFEATAVPEGVEEPEGGSIVLLTELWQTTDVPSPDDLYESWVQENASDAAFRPMAEDLASSAATANDEMAAAFASWDPHIAAGLLRVAEIVEELEGSTIQSVTTVALVSLGATFNQDEILAWEPASMGDQLRIEVADAGREAAADAARSAIRGIAGGIFGGGRDRDEPAADSPDVAADDASAVQPLFRMTTLREDIEFSESADDVIGTLEARLGNYQVQTLEDLVGSVRR